MIRHVILWQLKEGYTEEAKTSILETMKARLEALPGKVPGLRSLTVQIRPLPSSNADAMLDSVLDDAQALEGYRVHPEHVAVADTCVRPFMKSRVCMDFEI